MLELLGKEPIAVPPPTNRCTFNASLDTLQSLPTTVMFEGFSKKGESVSLHRITPQMDLMSRTQMHTWNTSDCLSIFPTELEVGVNFRIVESQSRRTTFSINREVLKVHGVKLNFDKKDIILTNIPNSPKAFRTPFRHLDGIFNPRIIVLHVL
jgi:hypothetical protein